MVVLNLTNSISVALPFFTQIIPHELLNVLSMWKSELVSEWNVGKWNENIWVNAASRLLNTMLVKSDFQKLTQAVSYSTQKL